MPANRLFSAFRHPMVTMLLAVTFALPTTAIAQETESEGVGGKAQYVKFHPDFVVNLDSTEAHFLMVTVQGMSRQPEGIVAAKHHMAAIRHHILMLLMEQTPESVKGIEARQKLMDEALQRVQGILVAETGKPSIDAVLFTDFVVE